MSFTPKSISINFGSQLGLAECQQTKGLTRHNLSTVCCHLSRLALFPQKHMFFTAGHNWNKVEHPMKNWKRHSFVCLFVLLKIHIFISITDKQELNKFNYEIAPE